MGTNNVVVRREPSLPRTSVDQQESGRPQHILAPFRALLDAMQVASCIVGTSGEIVYANEFATEFLARRRRVDRPSFRTPTARSARDLGWDLTPLRVGAVRAGFLAVRRQSADQSRTSNYGCSPGLRWGLTRHQGRVLGLVVQGLTNAAIGKHLGIGLGTVEYHVSAILDKVGANNRTTLIARALDLGRS
jgi:DNA-binding CsgD family transcriptional regulator